MQRLCVAQPGSIYVTKVKSILDDQEAYERLPRDPTLSTSKLPSHSSGVTSQQVGSIPMTDCISVWHTLWTCLLAAGENPKPAPPIHPILPEKHPGLSQQTPWEIPWWPPAKWYPLHHGCTCILPLFEYPNRRRDHYSSWVPRKPSECSTKNVVYRLECTWCSESYTLERPSAP